MVKFYENFHVFKRMQYAKVEGSPRVISQTQDITIGIQGKSRTITRGRNVTVRLVKQDLGWWL